MFWDAQLIVPTGTIGGGNTIFTFPTSPRVLLLFRNGLLINVGVGNDYTLSGSQITFATAPNVGDNLMALVGW
jgi:hypothetical protein